MSASRPRDPMSAAVHLDRAAEILAAVEATLPPKGRDVGVANYLAIAQTHAAIAQARALILGRSG